MTPCNARFFVNDPSTDGNACILERGHAGSHITGESQTKVRSDGVTYISTIKWNDQPPILDYRNMFGPWNITSD